MHQKGLTDKAIETLVNCIRINPDDKEIYYELVRIGGSVFFYLFGGCFLGEKEMQKVSRFGANKFLLWAPF
jgi:hypothetical protein